MRGRLPIPNPTCNHLLDTTTTIMIIEHTAISFSQKRFPLGSLRNSIHLYHRHYRHHHDIPQNTGVAPHCLSPALSLPLTHAHSPLCPPPSERNHMAYLKWAPKRVKDFLWGRHFLIREHRYVAGGWWCQTAVNLNCEIVGSHWQAADAIWVIFGKW